MTTHDGVSKLWILRAGRGLSLDGCKDELEAIDKLIRHRLTFSPEGHDVATAIRATVEKALRHLEEVGEEADELGPDEEVDEDGYIVSRPETQP